MRVLVTGGRNYDDFDMMRHVLGAMREASGTNGK